MTRNQIAGIAAAALLSTALAVGVGSFLLSGDEPRPARAAERRMAKLDVEEEKPAATAAKPTRVRGTAVKRKVSVVAPPTVAARPKPASGRTRDIDLEARAAQREDALAKRTELLDQFADRRGWDDATTDEIGALMTDTVDYVAGTMARVEAGESLAESREEIRAYRAKQAAAIRELVGDEDFPAFVEAIHMQRFFAGEIGGGGDRPRAGRPRGGGGGARARR